MKRAWEIWKFLIGWENGKVSGHTRPIKTPNVYVCEDTCPHDCPLRGICYGSDWRVRHVWTTVLPQKGMGFYPFLEKVTGFPQGKLWRYATVGDLLGDRVRIDQEAVKLLTEANQGRGGFTYTHYPVTKDNVKAIERANSNGFTVNLSANNPKHALELVSKGIDAPITSLVPSYMLGRFELKGTVFIPCPAITHGLACAVCRLCARPGRQTVITFPAHGSHAKMVSAIVQKGIPEGLKEKEKARWGFTNFAGKNIAAMFNNRKER